MESKVKVAGHAAHPILIVFPLGLLATAVVFDVIGMITDATHWTQMAYYVIGAGLIGGIAAAVPGWVDWAAIPSGTRAKRVGLLHGVGNVIVLALFIVSWLLRRPNPAAPPTEAVAAGIVGVVLAVVTGWLGGELVERLGVGMDDGAHLDAPSSLSQLPASARPRAQDRRTYPQPSYAGVERRLSSARR